MLKYFNHLTNLKRPTNFVKWSKSYVDHRFDQSILQNEQLANEKAVENFLKKVGPVLSFKKNNTVLLGYLKGLGHKASSTLHRPELIHKIHAHKYDKSQPLAKGKHPPIYLETWNETQVEII